MRIDKGSWGNWITEGWSLDQIIMSAEDRSILRALASEFRELCERPIEQEKISLWIKHNDLAETRPLLLVDMENGWNECLRFDRDIKCTGYMAQDWEMWLRKEIIYARNIQDDKPLTPVFYIPHRAVNTEWGIDEKHFGATSGDRNTAYTWEPTLSKYDEDAFMNLDVDSVIEDPIVKVDEEASQATFKMAKEVFADILDVQFRTSWFWSSHVTLAYVTYRGLEQMMYDFYDYPDKVKEMMQKFTEGYIKKLKFLEAQKLLPDNSGNTFVGSGGLGWTNQLYPSAGGVQLNQMWGLCEAQEALVSPDIFKEFILPCHMQVAKLFGLICYACCEPADNVWDYVKTLPNLRRVSVSQWASMERMSEYLGKDYVYSYKANSSDVATTQMDEEVVRMSLRKMLEYTKGKNNVEIVLKDLHTIGNKPEQVYRWVSIAREEIARIY
ncbi:MAG: hypothetical protein ACOYJC_09030 [Christensenellales bacterium]